MAVISHPRPEPRQDAANPRVVLFLLLLAFLNLQGDGLRLARDERTDQLLLLPVTLIFGVLLFLLLQRSFTLPRRLALLFEAASSWQLLLKLALVAITASLVLFVLDARYYQRFGYRLHLGPTIAVFSFASLLLALSLRPRSRPSANRLFAAVTLAYAAVTLLSLYSFPLAVERSDMLPLLSAAGHVLLRGADPYRLYTFPNETVFLTYLPGTLLAFLPSTVLHLDLRLTNLACVLGLATLVYRAVKTAHRHQTAAFLGVWLLSPYLLYRHDIYTPPHWLALIAALLLTARGKLYTGAVLFGISMALSQFSWVLLPFFLLFLFHRGGLSACARLAAVVSFTALAIMLPFAFWSPHAFVFGVLSHWGHQAVSARPVNLSYWLAEAIGPRRLQLVQLVSLSALFLASVVQRSCSTFTGLLRSMAAALTIFIVCNILVWGYFFLLLEVLLLLYVLAANDWLKEPQQPSIKIAEGTSS